MKRRIEDRENQRFNVKKLLNKPSYHKCHSQFESNFLIHKSLQMSLSPHKILILWGNTSKVFCETYFARISNERHSLDRLRTAILKRRSYWSQFKLDTELFALLMNPDLQGWRVVYIIQKHTSIEGQNSKKLIFFYSPCLPYSRFQL